jgi:hypothetical protein
VVYGKNIGEGKRREREKKTAQRLGLKIRGRTTRLSRFADGGAKFGRRETTQLSQISGEKSNEI